MCLAIYQPAGKDIETSHLVNGWKNNPDGGGLIYFDDDGRIQHYKSKNQQEFIGTYNMLWDRYGMDSPFAVHFRWATHGVNDITNVHPFRINDDTWMVHNGVINCQIPDSKMSDTASFAANYLAALPKQWFDNEFLFDMVQDYCVGSKLIVMTQDPKAEYCAYIVNEKSGKWLDGIWYSNDSYCEVKPKPTFFTPKSVSSYVYEDEESPALGKCDMCGEAAVFDDVCYECETCQLCFEDESACVCSGQLSFHNMTDHEYYKFNSVV